MELPLAIMNCKQLSGDTWNCQQYNCAGTSALMGQTPCLDQTQGTGVKNLVASKEGYSDQLTLSEGKTTSVAVNNEH